MSSFPNADIILSRSRDWFEWYDNLVSIAKDYELEDLVNFDRKNPVAETQVLLPKPEKPNPLELFPNLLDTLPGATLQQVAIPVVDKYGIVSTPARPNFIRNQAIEDDALVHLTSAQAGGWSARWSMYNDRERRWRQQRTNVRALRKWIENHIDPAYVYRIRSIEEIPQVVTALRLIFPHALEDTKLKDEYNAVLDKAGPDLPAEEWLRQWNMAYGRVRRYAGGYLQDDNPLEIKLFIMAVGQYDLTWAGARFAEQRKPGAQKGSLGELADRFGILLEVIKYGDEDEVGQGETEFSCPCRSKAAGHNPQRCAYVNAAVTGYRPERARNKTRLNETREALKEPQWADLVHKVKENSQT